MFGSTVCLFFFFFGRGLVKLFDQKMDTTNLGLILALTTNFFTSIDSIGVVFHSLFRKEMGRKAKSYGSNKS